MSGVVTINFVFYSPGDRIADCSQASGALIREYVWLNGEPLAVIEGGVVNFVRVDHIGRPVFATNSSVTKTWTASHLPFGEVRTTTGTPIALRFSGQWFQSESGLHQNWMRDYDPTTGRYVEADPLGLVDGASVYGYVRQSPMMFTDPTGEFIPLLVFAAGVAFGLYVDYQLEHCGCNSFGAFERWTGVGAAWAEYGPTYPKSWASPDGNTRRIGGSSYFTSRNNWNAQNQWPGGKPGSPNQQARHAARDYGKSVWKGARIFGAAFFLFDSYRLARCWGYL